MWQVSVEVHFENFVTIVKIWEEIFFLQNILNRKKYYIILKNIYKELFLILNHLKGWRKKKKLLENKTKNYYNNLFWFKNILYLGYCYNVICVLSADQYLEHMEQGSHGCMSSKMVNREQYGLMAIKLHNHLHSFSLFINHFLHTRLQETNWTKNTAYCSFLDIYMLKLSLDQNDKSFLTWKICLP